MPTENTSPEPDLTEIEAALGSLAPCPIARRDRILFEAGRASARRASSPFRRRLWPTLAAGLGLVAAGEAALLTHRPPPEVVVRTVVVRDPAPSSPEPARVQSPAPTQVVEASTLPPPPADFAFLSVRNRPNDPLLSVGPDGLPAPRPAFGPINRLPALSGRDLLRQEIRNALTLGGRS